MIFDLSGDNNVQLLVSTLIPHLLRARGQVGTSACHVAVAYKEMTLFGSRADSISVRASPYYYSQVDGSCGNFDGDKSNDESFYIQSMQSMPACSVQSGEK